MPNIAVTTYCNLHCPYCFADEMIGTASAKNIDLKQFKYILNWISKSNCHSRRIGIIGGEPTLHPEFSEILSITEEYCLKNNSASILFTNGIYLTDYLYDIPSTMLILLNLNTPNAMAKDQWQKLNNNLDKMFSMGWLHQNDQPTAPKVTLGCNLCPQIDDYSFFWEIVKKYQVKEVRMSVTAPTAPDFLADKDKYYTLMYPKFIQFEKDAFAHDVFVIQDCNQIPHCYFSTEDLKLITKTTTGEQGRPALCQPVVDITPDFTASACFGAYKVVDCNDFENFDALYTYLLYTQTVPKALANNKGKCANCEKHEKLQCQGGCLAFVN